MSRMAIAIFLLLWLSISAHAAERPVSEPDFAAYKELAQTKLDATKESLQKDREKTELRLDSQDKRIGDLSFTLTAFGAFLTVLVLVAGGVGWVSVRDRTREETRETAKKWFEEKAGEMEREIATLRQRAQESHDLIEKLKCEAESHFQSATDDVREKAAAVMDEMQKDIGNLSGKTASGEVLSTKAKDGEALERLEQALRNKPEAEYGFDDWNTRAFNAWHKSDFEGAARYWKSVAQAADATNAQIAQSLFNAGVALGQLGRSEDAIAAYNEVVNRFGDSPEAALRELVAQALVNKGFVLGKLDRNEEAIAAYDEVVKRYGAAPEVALREPVARALNGKGFNLLRRAKERWADGSARLDDLQGAVALFVRAVEDYANKPIVWGNQAYAAFLLDQPEVASLLLLQALQQGGESLYQATLGDLEIHPVPLDEAFRTMLEELWAEVTPQSLE